MKVKHSSLGLGVLAFSLSAHLLAQDPLTTADLELTVVQGPATMTPPGSTGTLVLQVFNHGPEIAGLSERPGFDSLHVFVSDIPFRDGFGSAVHFIRSADDDCYRFVWAVNSPAPGQPTTAGYVADFHPLDPGHGATCTLEYEVSPGLDIEPFRSEVGNSLTTSWHTFGVYTEDLNPGNDTVDLVFRFRSEPIPTLTRFGLGTLTLGILLAYAFLRRGR